MRFLRVGPLGQERPVLATDDDHYYDLRPVTADIDAQFLAEDGLNRAERAFRAGDLSRTAVDGERIGTPLRRPTSLICIGMNYEAHAAESGAAAPENVVFFFKKSNAVIGPNDDVLIPVAADRVDWEVELGVVIGAECRYLTSREAAQDRVAGYVLVNDVSERGFQLDLSGGQWSKGKCCETFSPMGPWLATPGYLGDPQALRLRSWVNDQPRQDSNTADMIFGVADIICALSQYMVLEAGDVICTGTPQGVALSGRFHYLGAGDVMRLEIDRLGSMQQRLRPAELPDATWAGPR